MNKKLLILTEAGTGIGFGHYMRCLALLRFFEEKGVEVKMFLDLKGEHNPGSADLVDWKNDKDILLQYSGQIHSVLIDSYLADPDFYSFLKSSFEKVIALDDFNRIAYDANIVINPNIYGNELNYSNQKGLIAGGEKFVILRKEFRKSTRKYVIREDLKNVLITVGGSDNKSLIPRLLTLLKNEAFDISVISGNDEYKEKIKKYCEGDTSIEIIGFANAELMLNKMIQADLVISACGQTLHELAYLGIPCIGITSGDDQVLNMKNYVKSGYLLQEIYWNDVDIEEKIFHSIDILRDRKKRSEVSMTGRSIIRGDGLENIYKKIFPN